MHNNNIGRHQLAILALVKLNTENTGTAHVLEKVESGILSECIDQQFVMKIAYRKFIQVSFK